MTTLFLVRHATHGQVGRALVGRAPGVPLSPEGVAQAAALGRRFGGMEVARVLSSPIQRATETAGAIARACGRTVEVEDALTEIDCGDWTGLSFADLDRDPRWAAWNAERSEAAVPGGETFAAVEARAAALLDRLAGEGGGPIVLVSHADVIKAAVMALTGMPARFHHRILVEPASVTTLELWGTGGGGRLTRLNEAP